MQTTIKKRFYHNGYKVVVVCKPEGELLIPLKFDVYYNSTKMNYKLTYRQIKMFEAAIYDELNYKSHYC